MEEKRLFLPLTIEKKYWDLTQKMVFLNQVYAEQLKKNSTPHNTRCVRSNIQIVKVYGLKIR